jgi:sigma-B regulation protein RsbU (phosphoserine phosphatase)
LEEDTGVEGLETGPLRELFEEKRVERIVPLRSGAAFHGVLLTGHKANRKPLSEEDIEYLRSLAAQGAASLDNLRLTREWVEKQKIEKELAVAREIQRGLLPDHDPSLPGWDIGGINIPSLAVGGDYYDYLAGPDNQLDFVIADVSGKGTGPALLMATVQASLRALAGLGDLPLDVVLTRLNEQLFRSSEANKYVTVFYGRLDPENGDLAYTNAGHCYPLLFRRSGDVERLVAGGPVIGLLPEVPLEVGRTSFEPGDMLVAYTDGLSETTSPGGEEFQEERIIEAAREAESRPAREVVAKLVAAARIYAAGAGLGDDLTLIVVKRQ